MNASAIEPGLLRVFRGYAGVRLVLYTLVGLRLFLAPERPRPFGNDPFPDFWIMLLGMALLLGYLSWPWLGSKLGRAYLPLGITLAAVGLIVERTFTPSFAILLWQPDAFFFVLLILVAWQYDFRAVLAFTLGTTGLEIVLGMIFPQPTASIEIFGEISDQMIIYINLLARTIAFLIVGFVITRLMSAQRVQRKALADANRKLVQYASTVEQLTISRERNRLSRELHDTLAHTLSALAVQVDAVMAVWEPIPDKAREMLEGMLDTTRRGLDETRRALKDLRAAPLEDMGLALAVRTLAEDYTARHELSLQLEVPEDIDSLPPEIEHGYYRVAQEALENIAQHAGAQKVRVKLISNNGDLYLEVADDGKGLDADLSTTEQGLGLQGMRERAELIGANLEVKNSPDGGTLVRLSMEK